MSGPRTPKRKSLLDVCEMAHEMFDGGHPERVTAILSEHLGPENPAADFVMAMWMLTANMLAQANPAGRQHFIDGMSRVASKLPADGATVADVSKATGVEYGWVGY